MATTQIRSHKNSRSRLSALATQLGLAGLIVFALFPVVWITYTSFRPESDIIAHSVSLIPESIGLDNYVRAWTQSDFPATMGNSLLVVAMTVVITVTLATFAAYSISRARFRGRRGVLGAVLSIRVIPGVLLLIPLYILMQQLNLLDTRIALTLTYTTFTLPAAIWFMKGFFDALPVDLENAARVDGCSRIRALFQIVLPLVRPGLAASAILVAIESWNDILFALLLTSTNASRTWPVGMKLLVGEFQLPWGQLAAVTVLSLIPVIFGFALAGRSMISGLTAGALKD